MLSLETGMAHKSKHVIEDELDSYIIKHGDLSEHSPHTMIYVQHEQMSSEDSLKSSFSSSSKNEASPNRDIHVDNYREDSNLSERQNEVSKNDANSLQENREVSQFI